MLGRWTSSAGIKSESTISSTSTIVKAAAFAQGTLKFLAVFLNRKLFDKTLELQPLDNMNTCTIEVKHSYEARQEDSAGRIVQNVWNRWVGMTTTMTTMQTWLNKAVEAKMPEEEKIKPESHVPSSVCFPSFYKRKVSLYRVFHDVVSSLELATLAKTNTARLKMQANIFFWSIQRPMGFALLLCLHWLCQLFHRRCTWLALLLHGLVSRKLLVWRKQVFLHRLLLISQPKYPGIQRRTILHCKVDRKSDKTLSTSSTECQYLWSELNFQISVQILPFKFCVFSYIGRDHPFDLRGNNTKRDNEWNQLHEALTRYQFISTCLVFKSKPRPKLSTPALLLTTVKSFTPVFKSPLIRFSG